MYIFNVHSCTKRNSKSDLTGRTKYEKKFVLQRVNIFECSIFSILSHCADCDLVAKFRKIKIYHSMWLWTGHCKF